jgi:hypothetical protein
MDYEQEPLFFTAEEVVAKVTEAVNASYQDTEHRIQRAKDNLSFAIALDLVETLRNQVANEGLDKATAQDIYDTMKATWNWSEASLTVNQYLVTVTLDGSHIAEVEIEAEDEDEACDLVRDDFVLYNADVALTFRYNGDDYEHEVTGMEHELGEYQDSLEFTADEQ